eukprot:523625-Pelagomonas_calceolata.AAC.2
MGSEVEEVSPFDTLEDLDPSLVNGYQLFYEREVPFELRSAQGIDMPTEASVHASQYFELQQSTCASAIDFMCTEICATMSITQLGALEAIRVKILVKGQPEQLESIKIELASEANLFFHYAHEMDASAFAKMQAFCYVHNQKV